MLRSYQVYDKTNFRYYTKKDERISWGFFKNDAYRFATFEEARQVAQFWRGVNNNNYKVLTVDRKPTDA